MERREWDDDDGFVPPPSQRAWRHPSELGRHGYRPPARSGSRAGRPGRAQFALAVAAGAVGSLAIATLAVLVSGAADRATTATDDRGAGGARAASAAPEFTLLSTTIADEPPIAPAEAANPAPAPTPDEPATIVAPLAVPAVLTLRASGDAAAPDIAAVVVDDTTLLADAADIGATTRYEALLADGSAVSVLVEGTDDATGLVRLRTRGSGGLAVSTAAGDSTWLGVRCVDETASAPVAVTDATSATAMAPPDATTTTSSSPVTTGASTPAATASQSEPTGSSTSAAATGAARASVPTTVSASTTTGLVTTTSSAPGAKPSTITRLAPTSAQTTSGAPAATTTVAATSTTAAAPAEPDGALPAAGERAVRVRDVMEGSPAAQSGILPGDVVVAVDGRPVRSMWALVLAVRRHAPGETVAVQVRRDGSPHEMTVVLGVHPGSGA